MSSDDRLEVLTYPFAEDFGTPNEVEKHFFCGGKGEGTGRLYKEKFAECSARARIKERINQGGHRADAWRLLRALGAAWART